MLTKPPTIPPDEVAPVAVIGAGPSGLAAAWALQRADLPAVLLERADQFCSSWRSHYRSLRLNSPRRLSSLPGMPMERRLGRWVARDDFIDYVERYARAIEPNVRFGTEVKRIDRHEGGWLLNTSRGPLWARAVVVAAGLNARPTYPEWFDPAAFDGIAIHATEYVDATPFAGRSVLVAGLGASGTDIAIDLVAAGTKVVVAVRTPPIIFRRDALTAVMSQMIKHGWVPRRVVDVLSLWIHRLLWGDLSDYGLRRPTMGMGTALAERGHGATMDRGFISLVREGRITIAPSVRGFDGAQVELIDGAILRPDVVVAATGQHPDLESLVGHLPGVLTDAGRPAAHGGRALPEAPNLFFLGFRIPPGQLPDLGIDARAIARRIGRRRHLRSRNTRETRTAGRIASASK